MPHTKSAKTNTIGRRGLLKGIGLAAAAAATATAQASPALAQQPVQAPTAMRSPGKADRLRSGRKPVLPSLEVIAMNRMAFGPRPGDLDRVRSMGFENYVAEQLDPASIDDSEYETLISGLGFATLNKSLTQLWADHHLNYLNPPSEFQNDDWEWRQLPALEIERLAFNRALYSRRQLQEVLADFWHNHFTVYAWESPTYSIFTHYDRDVIRPHMLGNFREMLEAVAKSTEMLYYLDNRTNSGGTPNENYARELFELHAMGAENYLGTLPQNQVALDSNGLPVAYVDDDVYGATTCFTGWQVDTNTGEFFYNSSDHFPNQKVVFGDVIPANQPPLKDGQDVLDMLASHPGTGRYLARKLCRRLISDSPPESLVQQVADLFTAQKDAPDQLKQVVRTILLSDEFKTTWGEKIKRPFEAIISALRAVGSDFHLPRYPFSDSEASYSTFITLYDRQGQSLFAWRPPNGYPDLKEDWSGTVSLGQRWRAFNWLFDWQENNTRVIDIVPLTPSDNSTANVLVDFWLNRIMGRSIPAEDRQQMVNFMAQGRNPDVVLPLATDTDTQHRLRMLVSLILNSPEFQYR